MSAFKALVAAGAVLLTANQAIARSLVTVDITDVGVYGYDDVAGAYGDAGVLGVYGDEDVLGIYGSSGFDPAGIQHVDDVGYTLDDKGNLVGADGIPIDISDMNAADVADLLAGDGDEAMQASTGVGAGATETSNKGADAVTEEDTVATGTTSIPTAAAAVGGVAALVAGIAALTYTKRSALFARSS